MATRRRTSLSLRRVLLFSILFHFWDRVSPGACSLPDRLAVWEDSEIPSSGLRGACYPTWLIRDAGIWTPGLHAHSGAVCRSRHGGAISPVPPHSLWSFSFLKRLWLSLLLRIMWLRLCSSSFLDCPFCSMDHISVLMPYHAAGVGFETR